MAAGIQWRAVTSNAGALLLRKDDQRCPTWVRRLMRPLVGGAKTCKGNGSAADALHGTAQHAYFFGAGGASERPHLGLPSLPAGRRTRAGPLLEKPINVRARTASRISAPLVVDCAQLRARIPPGHAGGHQADAAVNCASTVKSAKTLFFLTVRWILPTRAGVAELADALDSKSSDRKVVWVRFPPPAVSAAGGN